MEASLPPDDRGSLNGNANEFSPASHPMSRATPLTRDIAERLIAFETGGAQASQIQTPPAFVVCDKLRPHLAMLMGKGGFSALFSRARALAEVEVPALRGLRVRADGSLVGCEETDTAAEDPDVAEGGVMLLAQLLGLLEAFIGRNLTLRMLRDVWPELTLSDPDFSKDKQP